MCIMSPPSGISSVSLCALDLDVAARPEAQPVRRSRPVADALVQACDRIEPLGQPVGGGAGECLCGHTSSKPHATEANLNRR